MPRFLATLFPAYLLVVSFVFDHAAGNKTSEIEQIYKAFIEAVNSQDAANIEAMVIEYWSDELIGEGNLWLETDVNYWLAASKEFGPLEFVFYGNDIQGDNKIAWFKGSISHDWVGLEFDFDENNKILSTNVLRSRLPSDIEAIQSDKGISMNARLLQDYFERMERADLFSGMALIARGDEIIYEGYHGFADKENEERLSSSHTMVIASTAKMFTAIAIAQLVQQNKLDLNNPISDYLLDFPERVGSQVTTKHLLTHTSGLELDEIDAFNKAVKDAKSVRELYAINIRYLPEVHNFNGFAPLKGFNYADENFDLMGRLVEVISGQDFFEYLEEHIFTPLGMHNTGPFDVTKVPDHLAKTYHINREGAGHLDNGFRDKVPNSQYRFSRPSGAFYSTSRDLYAFLRAIHEGDLINRRVKSEFTSKKVISQNVPSDKSWYGYGFYVNERNGVTNVGHAGGMPGVSSRAEYYPDQNVYVVVISNYNWSADMTANYISTLVADPR